MEDDLPLPASFEKYRNIYTSASESSIDRAVRSGCQLLKKCEEMVSRLGLFSSNETKDDDIATSNLKHLMIAKALNGEDKLHDSLSADQKEELLEMAYSAIPQVGDKVMRQVKKLKSVEVLLKLEFLYMTKTLTSRIFLKGKLMNLILEDKPLNYLDDFAKLITELKNIDVEVDDEDQTLIILNALPSTYSNFVETMRYSSGSISLGDVLSALRSKVIESGTSSVVGDGLVVYAKGKKNDNKNKNKSKNAPKSQPETDGILFTVYNSVTPGW